MLRKNDEVVTQYGGAKMEDFKELYFYLFGKVADALEELEKENIGRAKEILITAMQEAEKKFIENEDAEWKIGVTTQGRLYEQSLSHLRWQPPLHKGAFEAEWQTRQKDAPLGASFDA